MSQRSGEPFGIRYAVGISVETAVDVAREAADIVLLQHDISVLNDDIRKDRVTFANRSE